MDLGLHYWNFSAPGNPQRIADTLAAAAQTAEEAGFAEFSVMDHYFQIEQRARAGEPMLEAYTTLGYVAALTRRIRLAVLVTGVMYRHPGLLAKIVSTLDVLSGGRAQLGIGASWYEREQRGLGVPFAPTAERFERIEETLQICLQMWSNNNGPYLGKHYQLAETLCVPAPLSRPRPSILIGGGGERKTLRLVARYATRATCRHPALTTWPTNWMCCARTAMPKDATTTPSARLPFILGPSLTTPLPSWQMRNSMQRWVFHSSTCCPTGTRSNTPSA